MHGPIIIMVVVVMRILMMVIIIGVSNVELSRAIIE